MRGLVSLLAVHFRVTAATVRKTPLPESPSRCSQPRNRNGAKRQILQRGFKIGDEFCIIDPAERCRILPELLKRFRQLRTRSIEIALAQVVHADGGLNETLIEEAEGPAARAPKIFPGFVGVKIPAGIKAIYSVVEQVGHNVPVNN